MRHILVALLALVLAGCHREFVVVEQLRADQIVELTRQGQPPEEIIRKIHQSRTVYIMDAQDIVDLDKRGVDKAVIDCMIETHRRDLRRRRHHRDRVYFYPHPHVGFGWGPYW